MERHIYFRWFDVLWFDSVPSRLVWKQMDLFFSIFELIFQWISNLLQVNTTSSGLVIYRWKSGFKLEKIATLSSVLHNDRVLHLLHTHYRVLAARNHAIPIRVARWNVQRNCHLSVLCIDCVQIPAGAKSSILHCRQRWWGWWWSCNVRLLISSKSIDQFF